MKRIPINVRKGKAAKPTARHRDRKNEYQRKPKHVHSHAVWPSGCMLVQ